MMDKRSIIERYIDAYNAFDIEGMVAELHDEIHFQNIVEDEINLSLLGRTAFKEQAIQASSLFSERKQTILDVIELGEHAVEVNINYEGIAAMSFPNGMQEGQKIQMEGKSIFEFSEDKIISLKDIS